MMQDHAGAVGAVATASTGIAGFVVAATPYLQFACLCISFIVGVLTAVWYIRKLHRDN